MRVVRRSVFETNSSSVHSVCVVPEQDFMALPGQTYIVVPEEYGWSGPTLKTPEEKLSYLMSLIGSNSGFSWYSEEEGIEFAEEEFLDLPDVQRVVDAVKKHGSKMLFKRNEDGFGKVDHQSVMSLTDFLAGLDLEDFIFNAQYSIIIESDG